MAQPDELQRAKAFCREIFPDVSRTFALSIRLIPGELGAAVRYAYLICRIADTIEDEPQLPAVEKASLLDLLTACFDDATAATKLASCAATLEGDARHLRLVRNTDLVFTAFRDLPESTRQPVRRWIGEMIAGMRKFVLAYPNGIRIQSLDEYKEYCYYVAGTVGFLLTDLWHEYVPSIGPRRYRILRDHCQAFAEALQTVDISTSNHDAELGRAGGAVTNVGHGHAGEVEVDTLDEHVRRDDEAAVEHARVVADPDRDAAARGPGGRRDRGHQVVL